MNEFIAFLDVARRSDCFVLMVSRNRQELVEGQPDQMTRLVAKLSILYIDRWFALPYRAMVEKAARMLNHAELANNTDLLIDATGVGDPVVEMFHELGISALPIIVTGGKDVREVYNGFGSIIAPAGDRLRGLRAIREFHVPKADLAAAGEIMLQNRRVSIAKGLKYVEEFQKQLIHMNPRATPAGNVKYESDDNKVKDDMAFCFIGTCWWALRRLKDGVLDYQPERESKDWDPIEYM